MTCRHNQLFPHSLQQFGAQAVAAVTLWHHQPGHWGPSGVLLWARHILHQSSFCDAAVSLRSPDRQHSRDDNPTMRAEEQVETSDRTLGSNYEWNPRARGKEPTAGLSLSKIHLRPLIRVLGSQKCPTGDKLIICRFYRIVITSSSQRFIWLVSVK